MKQGERYRKQLDAAEGWLELGNHGEAAAELDRLPRKVLASREVLELRCRIYVRAGEWSLVKEIATACTESFRKDSVFFCYLGLALYAEGDCEKALEVLTG